jgi:hypothetical protein
MHEVWLHLIPLLRKLCNCAGNDNSVIFGRKKATVTAPCELKREYVRCRNIHLMCQVEILKGLLLMYLGKWRIHVSCVFVYKEVRRV